MFAISIALHWFLRTHPLFTSISTIKIILSSQLQLKKSYFISISEKGLHFFSHAHLNNIAGLPCLHGYCRDYGQVGLLDGGEAPCWTFKKAYSEAFYRFLV